METWDEVRSMRLILTVGKAMKFVYSVVFLDEVLNFGRFYDGKGYRIGCATGFVRECMNQNQGC